MKYDFFMNLGQPREVLRNQIVCILECGGRKTHIVSKQTEFRNVFNILTNENSIHRLTNTTISMNLDIATTCMICH